MATTELMPVEFAGATLYIINQDGIPFTPMKPIVEAMGIDWSAQHAKLKTNAARWGMGEIAIPSTMGEIAIVETVGEIVTQTPSKDGKTRSMACIPLRKLPGWMMTIHPNKVKDAAVRERIVRYQNECDDVLWAYWNKSNAQSPSNPRQLPSDKISPAQRQHLRELVQIIVESGKQGHGETWNRLHRKFKINEYKELPAAKFDDAVAYLQGKMDGQSMAALVQKHFPDATKMVAAPAQAELNLQPVIDMERIRQTMAAANEVAAKVQSVVFFELLNGKKNWQNERWCLSFSVDGRNDTAPPTPRAWQIERDAVIAPLLKLASDLGKEGGMLLATISELLALNSASSQALSRRLAA